jgi:hypothetical protein
VGGIARAKAEEVNEGRKPSINISKMKALAAEGLGGTGLRRSTNVKVFGCRPLTNRAATPAAGVGKPPREETAGDGAVAVPAARPMGI